MMRAIIESPSTLDLITGDSRLYEVVVQLVYIWISYQSSFNCSAVLIVTKLTPMIVTLVFLRSSGAKINIPELLASPKTLILIPLFFAAYVLAKAPAYLGLRPKWFI